MQIFFSLFVFGEVWRSSEKEVTLSSVSINNKIMTYIETEISGVWIIEPKVFKDARGYFMEAWKKAEFEEHIGKVEFVQDNESCSSKGVLRGLHYQLAPYSQSKLVRVIKGCVLDVAVDLRKGSPTFGRYVAVELSDENKRQFFIPQGFAHGFHVMSEEAVFTIRSIILICLTMNVDYVLMILRLVWIGKSRIRLSSTCQIKTGMLPCYEMPN